MCKWSLDCLTKYPIIRKLFVKCNTDLYSSTHVERLFSFAGFIMSPTRSCLSDTNFENLVFLKGNSDYKIWCFII